MFRLAFRPSSISWSCTPRAGTRTDDPTIRRVVASPYPYLIFYEATEDEVIIHAVRHGARDPSDTPGVG